MRPVFIIPTSTCTAAAIARQQLGYWGISRYRGRHTPSKVGHSILEVYHGHPVQPTTYRTSARRQPVHCCCCCCVAWFAGETTENSNSNHANAVRTWYMNACSQPFKVQPAFLRDNSGDQQAGDGIKPPVVVATAPSGRAAPVCLVLHASGDGNLRKSWETKNITWCFSSTYHIIPGTVYKKHTFNAPAALETNWPSNRDPGKTSSSLAWKTVSLSTMSRPVPLSRAVILSFRWRFVWFGSRERTARAKTTERRCEANTFGWMMSDDESGVLRTRYVQNLAQ